MMTLVNLGIDNCLKCATAKVLHCSLRTVNVLPWVKIHINIW